MKRPSIWIVMEVSSDSYHLWDKTPVAWFFSEEDAEAWAEKQPNKKNLVVEECPGVTE